MKKIKAASKVSESGSETNTEWFDLSFSAAQLPICERQRSSLASHRLHEDKLLPVNSPGFTLRGDK